MGFSALLVLHGMGSSMYAGDDQSLRLPDPCLRFKNICMYFSRSSAVCNLFQKSRIFSRFGDIAMMDKKHTRSLSIIELESCQTVVTTLGVCATATPATNRSAPTLCSPSCTHLPQYPPALPVVLRPAGSNQGLGDRSLSRSFLLIWKCKAWWG